MTRVMDVQVKKEARVSLARFISVISITMLFVLLLTGSADAVGNHSMQETVNGSNSGGDMSLSGFYMLFDLIHLFVRSPIMFIVTLVIFIIVAIVIKKNASKIKDGIRGVSEMQEGLRKAKALKREAMLTDMQKRDPNFSEEQFISKAQNIFIQLQEAWSTKNWQIARMYETDALFNAHNKQFEEIVNRNRTNHIENITFVNTDVVEYDQDGNNDIARVLFEVRLIDYTVDNETGQVVFGDRKKILHLKYLYTFIRSKDVVTEDGSSINTTNCPSCGAPINVNASGMCEYCGTTVVNGTYDWVVSNVESKPHYTV